MSSRLSRLVGPLNAVFKRAGLPGRLVVVGHDWYDEDGLLSAHNWDFITDVDFSSAYRASVKRTGLMSGPKWRTHIAVWVARNCSVVEGDFIELGVGRGWMSSTIIASLPWKSLGKDFWLFDRFEDNDVDPVSGQQLTTRNSKGTYCGSLAEAERIFAGLPNVHLVAGSLPATLSMRREAPVAFVHADLNAADPEVQSVETLWDHLSPGGMVLFDDYAYRGYSPQYHATRELVERLKVPVLALPTGQGLIVKAK